MMDMAKEPEFSALLNGNGPTINGHTDGDGTVVKKGSAIAGKIRRNKCTLDVLIQRGIVHSVDGYDELSECQDLLLEIGKNDRSDILLMSIIDPTNRTSADDEIAWSHLLDVGSIPDAQIRIADKLTLNARRLIDYVNFVLHTN